MNFYIDGHAAYADTGGPPFDPALPCVVFIHGALHDHSVWAPLAQWAAQHGHSVLAVDLPGHGLSTGPVLPSIEALAAWTLSLLDAAGVSQAALVGHSMGSLVALEAAALGAERIRRLVMIATAYPMKVSASLLATARETPLRAMEKVNAFSFSSAGGSLAEKNLALMQRMQSGWAEGNLFEHDFAVCDRYAHGMEAASRVQCPVTFILGAQDRMTAPTAASTIAQALDARIVTLPGGHSLMQDQPDAVLNALRSALV